MDAGVVRTIRTNNSERAAHAEPRRAESRNHREKAVPIESEGKLQSNPPIGIRQKKNIYIWRDARAALIVYSEPPDLFQLPDAMLFDA